MTFEAGKTYETRDGREARVYATDGAPPYVVHGAIRAADGMVPHSWAKDGRWGNSDHAGADLIAPKPEPRRVWLSVRDEYEHEYRPTQFVIGPDGALRVV